MGIQVQGFGGTIAEVDPNNRALRISNRPLEYGTLGFYGVNLSSGTMAAGLAANAEFMQFRWTDATRLAVIERIGCEGAGSILAFAAGFTQMTVTIARSWSSDGSGGAAATTTGNNNKLRTSMGTSLVGAIRMSTTAALTAGTKTLDSQPIGATTSSVTATAGAVVLPTDNLYQASSNDNHPVILVQNEGVVVRVTVPATGTWTGAASIRWAEVTSY